MYGVVLWSDSKCSRAVIWCEDHRNLAFFRDDAEGAGSRAGFTPGDLVAFDLREENELRLAVDPYVVAPHEFPSLAMDLKSAFAGLEPAPPAAPRADPPRNRGERARVVSLFQGPDTACAAPPPRARHCG
jgi:hypothetical protein